MHASLSDHLLDLVQNALEAGSNAVMLDVRVDDERVEIFVSDDGCGMNADTLARALDPFFSEAGKHPGRSAGLGLPFMRQAAEAADGGLELASEEGLGTSVHVWWSARHVDAPPSGDLAGAVTALMALPGDHELQVSRRLGAASWRVTRSELLEALGGLEQAGELALARRYIAGLEENLESNE